MDPSLGRNYSYSLNMFIMRNDIDGSLNPNPKLGIRLASVLPPAAKKIMIFEELAPNDTWCIAPVPSGDDMPTARHGTNKALNAIRDPSSQAYRNEGRANFVFFDGHVESLVVKDFLANVSYSRPIRAGDPTN